MDSLPANAIKSIFYFSSHPVADLIRPNIKTVHGKDNFVLIKHKSRLGRDVNYISKQIDSKAIADAYEQKYT